MVRAGQRVGLADPRGVPPAGMWGHRRSGRAASLSVAAETVRTGRGGEREEAASPPIQISGLRMGGVAINQDGGGEGEGGGRAQVHGGRCPSDSSPRAPMESEPGGEVRAGIRAASRHQTR